jgi:uncharacterized membrane protein
MTLFLIGSIALRVLCLAFFILLAVRIGAGIRARHVSGAQAILEKKFVEGQITEAEFRQKRAVLGE